MNQVTLHQSAVCFIDYDAIYGALKRYGLDPLELNFFPTLLDHLKNTHELDVIEAIVYADFDYLPTRHQTHLRQMGLTTRHCKEQSGGGLHLAVEAVTLLHDVQNIDIFVIVTGVNDLLPILSAIRYRNKFTFCITLKENFDANILNHTDIHEYLDDIFGFTPPGELNIEIDRSNLTFDEVRRARKVTKLLYESLIWKKYEATGKPISLKGYLAVISKAVAEDISQLDKVFKVAHFLKYVTLYQTNDKLYIKRGNRYKKVVKPGE